MLILVLVWFFEIIFWGDLGRGLDVHHDEITDETQHVDECDEEIEELLSQRAGDGVRDMFQERT